ncbi:MFS transporter [Kribbella sp. VKM Ac-2566]|uniref:MFS transporter n=1 Tax=Kribbella sp. VKM Ac-2566 TaxID=2512218 RepID=UPI0010631133|nr:MFS transporter [Kribbella sp. VKM Ac-2566]
MTRPATDPQAGSRSVPAAVLVALLTGTFMAQFDFFVVNVAAPSIGLDLQATEAELELVVGGYAFAYAGALVLGGRLGDLFGHRRLFVSGMIAFAATSVLCGLAVNSGQLIGARLGQGLSAALMLPQVLALISSGSSGHGRARAMAWYGVAGGVGSIAGQVLGGLLVTVDLAGLGWRLIFLINAPIGVIGALFAQRVLPGQEPGRSKGAKLDPLGALGFAVGLGLLLVPLTVGRTAGWPLWVWIPLAASVPALAATLRWQQALHRRGGQPQLELSLFRAASFRSGILSNLAFMLYFPSYMFTLALLLQGGLGLGAFEAGLVFVPAGVTFSVSALLAPRLAARYGSSVLAGGCLLAAAGLAALAVVTATGGADASVAVIVLITAAISFGNGLILPSLIGAALLDVPPHHAGAAAGALTTTQQFGSAAGVALVGTIYFAAAEHGAGIGMAWACAVNVVLVLSVAAAVRYGLVVHRRTAVHQRSQLQ